MKTNRACPMIWRTVNGKFLFWFNNHSGKSYEQRNPIWISGGVEKDGRIHWSQPEILLYDDDIKARMSYPDLIEQDGKYWITETNKTVARAHAVDKALLEGMWAQSENKTVARDGLVLELSAEQLKANKPELPAVDLTQNTGMALDVWLKLDDLAPGQKVLATGGVSLLTVDNGALRVWAMHGAKNITWDSDAGVLTAGTWHHVVVILDARAKIITFVVDGFLCNGGDARQFGWGRFLGGTEDIPTGAPLKGELGGLRVYNRHLRTSEAVGNFNAGRAAK
jgi:hypothetical protein